jgi:hypothetical protein
MRSLPGQVEDLPYWYFARQYRASRACVVLEKPSDKHSRAVLIALVKRGQGRRKRFVLCELRYSAGGAFSRSGAESSTLL